MSPQAFYCWLAERRSVWVIWPRLRPRPDQNMPMIRVMLTALAGACAMVVAAGVLVKLVEYVNGPQVNENQARGFFQFVLMAAAVFGALAGLVHGLFSALAWNQRAARIRTGTKTMLATPGRGLRWILGPIYLFGISFVLPVLLLAAFENAWGALRWRLERYSLELRGEKLRMEQLLPSDVPSDQNLAGIPLLSSLFDKGSRPDRSNVSTHPNVSEQLKSLNLPDVFMDSGSPPPNLEDWAGAFRAAIAAQSNGSTPPKIQHKLQGLPRYAAAPQGADDATVILTGLEVAQEDLKALCDAAGRPYSRFPIHWSEGPDALVPHLAKLKSVSRVLSLQAAAHLARHEELKAFNDVHCNLRLADSLREEPLLISQLVRAAQFAFVSKSISKAVEAHAWDEHQWLELQHGIEQFHFVASLIFAIEGERASVVGTLDNWATDRRAFNQHVSQFGTPTGWIRQSETSITEWEQGVLDLLRPMATNPPPDGVLGVLNQVTVAEASLRQRLQLFSPREYLVAMLAPTIEKAAQKLIQAEQNARSTEVVCALERFRVRTGAYPKSLEVLVPDYLPIVPVSLSDGEPLGYALTADARFKLWSGAGHERSRGPRRSRSGGGLDGVWP